MNEKHPRNSVRFDEYGDLENSTDITNLLVDDFNISTENTCGDASCPNGKNEKHTIIIHNMVRAGLLDSNKN